MRLRGLFLTVAAAGLAVMAGAAGTAALAGADPDGVAGIGQDAAVPPDGSPQCAGVHRQRVRIDFARRDVPVRYDLTKDTQAITAMGGETMRGAIGRGMTRDSFRARFTVDFIVEHVPGGVCMVPAAVKGEAGFDDMTVYLASDYPEGSCQYRAVKEHEDTHVRINMGALDAAFPRMRAALLAAAQGAAFPLFAPDRDAGKAMGTGQIDAALIREADGFRRAREAGHHMLDSPASYQRTEGECTSW
jgi:hypothetical protein